MLADSHNPKSRAGMDASLNYHHQAGARFDYRLSRGIC
jgi:hypothetical protein